MIRPLFSIAGQFVALPAFPEADQLGVRCGASACSSRQQPRTKTTQAAPHLTSPNRPAPAVPDPRGIPTPTRAGKPSRPRDDPPPPRLAMADDDIVLSNVDEDPLPPPSTSPPSSANKALSQPQPDAQAAQQQRLHDLTAELEEERRRDLPRGN
jgi:hypothetical protein